MTIVVVGFSVQLCCALVCSYVVLSPIDQNKINCFKVAIPTLLFIYRTKCLLYAPYNRHLFCV